MSRLPTALAPWAESLAQLNVALAIDLGPMIHLLDELVGRLDFNTGETGPLDGYDGMTNRGDPDRLLAAEWLLADEIPLEFLRRAAENELLYLRRAHQHVRREGRVVAIVDSGPDQLGAGRLVQLAALVVLDRRAHLAGSELSIADLQSGSVTTGPLAVLLPQWLRSRSPKPASADAASAVLADLSSEDQAWVLCGPATAELLPAHRRKVVSRVAAWDDKGATKVALRVGDSAASLPLPASPRAVAALRGEGLTRRTKPTADPVVVSSLGQGAVFTSDEPQLLWRGASANELYTVRVGPGEQARVRRHRLDGDILAASALGRRIVTLLTDGDRIWAHVSGRRLADVHELQVSVGALDLSASDIDDIRAAPICPLYFADKELLFRIKDAWWHLGVDGVRPASWIAIGTGPTIDNPRRGWQSGNGPFYSTSMSGAVHLRNVHRGPLFGPEGHLAWCSDPRVWKLVARDGRELEDIGVAEGEEVIGIAVVDRAPALVTVTPSGRIVRHITARTTKTWTAWAGPAHFDVHPTRPWLVRSTEERLLVGDLQTGQVLLDLKVDA